LLVLWGKYHHEDVTIFFLRIILISVFLTSFEKQFVSTYILYRLYTYKSRGSLSQR